MTVTSDDACVMCHVQVCMHVHRAAHHVACGCACGMCGVGRDVERTLTLTLLVLALFVSYSGLPCAVQAAWTLNSRSRIPAAASVFIVGGKGLAAPAKGTCLFRPSPARGPAKRLPDRERE